MIDTGSAGSAIDSDAAKALGLSTEGQERIEKNFREIVADRVEIPTFRIGNLAFNNLKFYEMNLASLRTVGAKVDGVLGNDILERMVFRLDYSRQQLVFESSGIPNSAGSVVALRRSKGQFLISTTLVSEPIDLVLDTGTNLTNLSWKSWERVTRTWKPTRIVEGITRSGNPTSPAILVCLPEVRLGDAVMRHQAVRAQMKSDEGAFASEDFGGILGGEILRHFEVTFDLGHDRIFLKRDTAYHADPYKYVTIGLQFGKDDAGMYRIMSVWKNTPASRAGLQPGDTLLAINREPTGPLTVQDISKRLHAREGTRIELTIERDQQRSTIALQTRRLLCGTGSQ